MAEQGAARSRVARLARELIWIRWRGLDNLDVHTSHQDPRDTPETDQLARAYCAARGLVLDDRVAEIRVLLQDSLATYWLQGHKRAARRFRRLYFEPSESVPPKTPRQVLQKLKAEMELAGEDYDAWRRIAFPQLAAFLIAFVAAAREAREAREAAEPQPANVVTVTPVPIPETPPPPRRGWARLALAGLVGLVLACIVVARLLVGAAASPNQAASVASAHATIIAGSVACWPDTTKAVEGVWIVASNGGSGWAAWHALPGHPNVALFSYTLPHGGSYVVHAGCGGTRAHWELALDSVVPVLASGYSFTCYDAFAVGNPYTGQCRP